MQIETIRRHIKQGAFAVTDHALTEGFKDGITVADMIQVLQTGKIIEQYPERHRCLVFGYAKDRFPVHVVVDCSSQYMTDIITTYVPQKDQWIKNQIRKKRKL